MLVNEMAGVRASVIRAAVVIALVEMGFEAAQQATFTGQCAELGAPPEFHGS